MIPLTVLAAGVAKLACMRFGGRAPRPCAPKLKATRIYQPSNLKRQFFLLIIPPFPGSATEQLGSDLRSDRSENHTPRPHALP